MRALRCFVKYQRAPVTCTYHTPGPEDAKGTPRGRQLRGQWTYSRAIAKYCSEQRAPIYILDFCSQRTSVHSRLCCGTFVLLRDVCAYFVHYVHYDPFFGACASSLWQLVLSCQIYPTNATIQDLQDLGNWVANNICGFKSYTTFLLSVC